LSNINASGFGGYSGGGSSGGGKGGGFSSKAPIINTGSSSNIVVKPKGIVSVASDIQSLSVLENMMNHEIPGEFFTLERSIDLFSVGAKSGLKGCY